MMNNRKYLQSTGLLLKNLNEDSSNFSSQNSNNNTNIFQQGMNTSNSNQHLNLLGNYLQQPNQYNQPNQFNHLQASNPTMNFQFNTNSIFNQPLNPLDLFHKNIQNTPLNLPDIMVLPNSMTQQRWQQKPKQQSSQNYNNKSKIQKNQQNNLSNKKNQSSSSLTSLSNSSSVTELPETFGLPSNQTSKQSSSISLNKHSLSSTNLSVNEQNNNSNNKLNDINSDDVQVIKSPVSQSKQSTTNDDIEIISEINSYSSQQQQQQQQQQQSNSTSQSTTADDLNSSLKNYLSKTYSKSSSNVNISIATKPQSNFISNLNCINQLLNKSDYYNNKLRRCKPYSSIKPNAILTIDDDDSSDEEDAGSGEPKIKNRKVILIDDSNEEMHKPWITPDLIKLIKHRNLLQTKLNESNKLDQDSEGSGPDAELLKKFKNLRNKVTKLVKKARKDYLAKYIQESKENKSKANELDKTSSITSQTTNETNQTQSQPAQPSSSISSTQSATSSTTISTQSNANPSTTTVNPAVNEITSKLKSSGSFLKDQNTLMMSLYSNYYNQYIQQYTKQQQQAQQVAQAAAKPGEKEDQEGYDMLQKQAAYYAQQQLAIQTQLENTLLQSAQQLIQEIAEAAAAKANQPFVLNQFTQQHHLHQHHHHIPQAPIGHLGPVPPNAMIGQNPMMQNLVAPPPPSVIGPNQMGPSSNMFY